MGKTAVITGITGQDGSYLAELLLSKGYEVWGVQRRSSVANLERVEHLVEKEGFNICEGDVTDYASMSRIIGDLQPDEVYNLAAQSHVRVSFNEPFHTTQVNYIGCLNLLEAIRHNSKHSKFYQASTSEMFGKNYTVLDDGRKVQNEDTLFMPQSPYAVAKLAAHHACEVYRDSYDIFACSGVLFNHESKRRGLHFVTRKITSWIGEFYNWWDRDSVLLTEDDSIRKSTSEDKFPKLRLGNLDSMRDWGHAEDYCINLDVPILTTSGWKFYDDICIGDEVINFDINSNSLSTDIIKRKILLDSSGDKIELSGRGVYLNVSYNHRIYYQQKSINSKGDWSNWKVCTAEEFYNKINDKALRTKYNYRLPHFQEYSNDDIEYSDDWIYLLGCLLTGGLLNRFNNDRGIMVSLSQSKTVNEKIYNKIDTCLNRLNLKFIKRNRNDGVTEWAFNAESSREILSLFDKLNIHMMPRWCYQMSSRQANILIDAMMDCDGHRGSMMYTSKRYMLAVDFQSIACLAGYRTTKLKKDKSGVYRVCLITKSKKYTYITNARKYNDESSNIWCVETNNGTIITRDNDCISISGNCKAMYLMLQQESPNDFVIATGHTYSIRDFLKCAFECIGIYKWDNYVVIDPKFYRPADVEYLCGDYSKAKSLLGWEPEINFSNLVKTMVEHDVHSHQRYERETGSRMVVS